MAVHMYALLNYVNSNLIILSALFFARNWTLKYSQMRNLCKLHTHVWWDRLIASVYLSSLQNHVSRDLSFSLSTIYTDSCSWVAERSETKSPATAAPNGLLYQTLGIISMAQWWDDERQEDRSSRRKTCSSATLSTISTICTALRLKPDFRD